MIENDSDSTTESRPEKEYDSTNRLTPTDPLAGEIAVACANHPRVNATCNCSRCNAALCPTCAFTYPNNLVYCPTCATEKPEVMTPARRKARLISYIMAGISTLSFGILFSGALYSLFGDAGEEAFDAIAGFFFMVLILLPSIVGLSFGIGALNNRRGNPLSITAPTILNGILLGIWILLTIIGNLS